jgi:hypothetical protein
MMSTPKLGLSQDQTGQAAVEALLVLMILALVIFGGIELSRGVPSGKHWIADLALLFAPYRWTPLNGVLPAMLSSKVSTKM